MGPKAEKGGVRLNCTQMETWLEMY
uniref:Uncharacterized protein n=1 Tax=Strigamia maritima TaxID=126957 RepID=T1JKL4_STRMM